MYASLIDATVRYNRSEPAKGNQAYSLWPVRSIGMICRPGYSYERILSIGCRGEAFAGPRRFPYLVLKQNERKSFF